MTVTPPGMERQERSVNDVAGLPSDDLSSILARCPPDSHVERLPSPFLWKIALTFDNWTGARNRRSLRIMRA